MPTYQYRCEMCNAEREVVHRMDESPTIYCTPEILDRMEGCGDFESCGPDEDEYWNPSVMRKIITQNTAGGFVLKGSGWYSTDSRKISTPSDVHGSNIQTDPRGKAI